MSRSAARADHGGSRAGCMPVAAALAGAAVALVVAGGIVAFLLLHTTGSPRATASAYLTAWQSRGYAEMDAVTVNGPPVVAPAVKSPVEPMLPPPVTVQLNDGCVVSAIPN